MEKKPINVEAERHDTATSKNIPTPEILFKFVTGAEHTRSIAGGSVKFTAISELNDPTEMLPPWNKGAYQQSLTHVRKHGCTDRELASWAEQEAWMCRLGAGHKRGSVPRTSGDAIRMAASRIYDNAQLMRDRLNAFIVDLRDRIGVCSLTEHYNSLPMWAHYADNAQGYLVAYRDIEAGLPKNKVPPLFQTVRVAYGHSNGVTFHPDSYRTIFQQKLADWAYEHEWRVIADLEECEDLPCQQTGRRLGGLVKIPAASVAAVFAGWRMQDKDFNTLKECVHDANRDATVIHLALDQQGWPDFSPIADFLNGCRKEPV